jgi:hypothetical protein
MLSTSTVVTLIGAFVTDLTSIIYGVIPQILVAVAILMGISLGVRYVRRWISGSAR